MSTEHLTYCRICEPLCAMVATVEDGKLIRLRPDAADPVTKGFSCPKGIEFVGVQNDDDRLLYPMKRVGDRFERISWDTALDEIGARLRAIRDAHGGESIGWYAGNPSAFSHSHAIWAAGFVRGLGSQHLYTPNSQDTSSRFVASALLYGSPIVATMPDLDRTSFLFMLGANPLVSRGSFISAGNMRERMSGIVGRGGRVVVVDPRRTETAKAFEHVSVRPDSDAWLLLGMLHVIFRDGLVDHKAIEAHTRGIESLRDAAHACSVATAARRTGLEEAQIVELACAFATAESAVAYGRTGACLGRFATLVNVLLDALNVVTGNLDRDGGAVFGRPPIDFGKLASTAGLATYDSYRSRVGGFPEVLGQLPAPLMAEEIRTRGRGQLRALIVSAGNPVLSVPGSMGFEAALGDLDLLVGVDLYINETHRLADYVLPAATFYERDDLPLPLLDFQLTPNVRWAEPVVEPRGEARPDWIIIDALAERLGFNVLAGTALDRLPGPTRRVGRWAGRLAMPVTRRITPHRLVDVLLRTGRDGDLFGLRRGGLSLKKLRAQERGVVLADRVETGVLRHRITHRDRKVRLDEPRIIAELARLLREPEQSSARFPLLLIGRREVRSQNSWLHNNVKFADGARGQKVLVNPADALEVGVVDGEVVRVRSPLSSIELPCELTDDVAPGTIAVPHGWGHRDAGWTVANAAGGANVNVLTSSAVESLERLSGMSHLNGVPVRLERVPVESGEQPAQLLTGLNQ